jgi:6,7-dimethyl-8-ribityllumazine synthase
MSVRVIQGKLSVRDARIVIVASRFNAPVVDALVEGAVAALKEQGLAEDNLRIVRVPGAFELPSAVRLVIEYGDPDGVIALGAVIRGETPHFEYVSSACTEGLSLINVEQDVALSFGLLTTDTGEQALARAGGDKGNKGAEAALAVLEMIDLGRQLSR